MNMKSSIHKWSPTGHIHCVSSRWCFRHIYLRSCERFLISGFLQRSLLGFGSHAVCVMNPLCQSQSTTSRKPCLCTHLSFYWIVLSSTAAIFQAIHQWKLDTMNSFSHSFMHAPLAVHIAKRRHQSPEWTILSHVKCFIQGEVIRFQVLLNSLHPRSTQVSWWSPPVL